MRWQYSEMVLFGAVAIGLGCIVYGVSMWSEPAAWIAAGLVVMLLAALVSIEV